MLKKGNKKKINESSLAGQKRIGSDFEWLK
jgi:hypothetical protein